MKQAIFLLGPPGAGKGTQAKILAEKLKFKQIDTGDIIRKKIKNPSNKEAQQAKILYEKGKLVPSTTVLKWLQKKISKINQSFVFSGSPRTLEEAKKLIPFLEKNNYQVKIFNIAISSKETLKRNLKRARGILDTKEKIKERLKIYKKQTKPILEFLKNEIHINGEQSIQQVHQDIWEAGEFTGKNEKRGQNSSPNNGTNCGFGCPGCPYSQVK